MRPPCTPWTFRPGTRYWSRRERSCAAITTAAWSSRPPSIPSPRLTSTRPSWTSNNYGKRYEAGSAGGGAECIRAAYAKQPPRRVPCHNDALAENFMLQGEQMRVIDWEYGGMNDGYYDIACVCVENPLDARCEDVFFRAYCGGEPSEEAKARLLINKFLVTSHWSTWSLVQICYGKDADFYWEYGRTRAVQACSSGRPQLFPQPDPAGRLTGRRGSPWEFIGTLITYLMMACCVVGGISYIVNDQSELGRAFQDGLHAMANMFIPICGLMASVPFLKVFISKVFGPVFALFGGDPVVAAAIIMPPDCGSFALATEIGQSADLFPVIIAIGFMCASTIAFNVPIGLSMLDKGDHKYLALGTMSGFLSVPFGVFITSVIVMFTHPAIRSTFSSVGEPDHVVMLTLGMLLRNMIPLVVICVLLALGLKFFPNGMVKGFMVFGKLMTGALTLVVVACILQHYTGLFTDILGVGWGFDPILADEENTFRAVELLGTIA